MGSEQSSHSGRSQSAIRTGTKVREHQKRPRSSSPGPSISSDSEIPYVPYTVNRPIGDSPKLQSKSPAHSLRASATPSPRSSPKALRPKSYAGSTSSHDIVVVKGVPSMDTLDTDPELMKLQKIPSFQPIMRGALNLPTIRDPEILDKLDNQAVLQLCKRYQEHLRCCAEVVSSEQNNLAGRIREIDFAIVTLTNLLTERQKKFIKYSEQLGKVHEISSGLKQCQVNFTEVIAKLDALNFMLPPENRLEPFVMVTG